MSRFYCVVLCLDFIVVLCGTVVCNSYIAEWEIVTLMQYYC